MLAVVPGTPAAEPPALAASRVREEITTAFSPFGRNRAVGERIGKGEKLADILASTAMVAEGVGTTKSVHSLAKKVGVEMPITEQVSHFVMNHAHAMASQRGAVPDNIEDDGPEGEAARAKLGQQAYDLNVQQYCAAGLNFGYFYDHSPIIDHASAGADTAPGYTMADYTPSTVPGCRLPHAWLGKRREGRSLYDALGPEYTLLRTDPDIDVSPLLDAAAAQGVPLALLDIPSETLGPALVIARPDQHIAWRGEAVPANIDALIGKLCAG